MGKSTTLSCNRKIICLLPLLLITMPLHTVQALSKDDAKEQGDFFAFALNATALGATWGYKDWEGTMQYFASAGTSAVTVGFLKQAVGKLRPAPTSSNLSFPSGHTSAAFSGASFLYSRYGRGWGIPAYLAAAYTGYTRVVADAHHVDDVLAGASISMFANWLWVTPHSSRGLKVAPMTTDDGTYGLSVSYQDVKKIAQERRLDRTPKVRYELAFGPGYLEKNEVQVNNDDGSTFDLENFQGTNDPTTTANVVVEWNISKKHLVAFSVEPFEARDVGQFSQPVQFNEIVFPANTDILSQFRFYDLRVIYGNNFWSNRQWQLQAGVSLAAQRTFFALTDGTSSSEVDEWLLVPLLNASVTYRLPKNWRLSLDVSGTYYSDVKEFAGNIMASYLYDDYWDFGLGYTYFDRIVETDRMHNDLVYNVGVMSVGYSFY